MIAACVLDPGVYFAINSPAGVVGANAADAVANDLVVGLPRDRRRRCRISRNRWAKRRCSRAPGGAPSLAVGMASIFSSAFGKSLLAVWYHFAIMFEALFILTTVDAGTRVARFMLQDHARERPAGDGPDELVSERLALQRSRGRRLGLLSLLRRHRSARRHQQPLAALRHRQSDARGDRALRRDRDHREVAQGTLRLGDRRCRSPGSSS